MALRIYRRHLKSCGQTSERYRRCRCPIHVEGRVGDESVPRRTLHLTNWSAAEALVREWEIAGTTKARPRISLREAIEHYKSDCASRNAPATVKKIEVLMKALEAFAANNGIEFLSELGTAELRTLRSGWTTWGPRVQQKMVERLRAAFRYWLQNKWIAESPADALKAPKPPDTEVSVFSPEEITKIHAAIRRPIMRAFVLTLQHTGLRISDAVRLRRQDIVDGRLRIRTQKTKSTVWVPLPPVLLAALDEIKTGDYYFWTGGSKLSTVIGSRRRGLAKLLKRAGVEGSPHTFRHTLGTNLLANGTNPAIVAKILGNSERVIWKHYDHWIPARQIQLESELRKTWGQTDPRQSMRN